MRSPRLQSRLTSASRPAQRLLAISMAAGLLCLAACGSDKDKTTPGVTPPTGDGNTVAPDVSVVNSDKKGTEPTTLPQSPAVKTTRNGTDTALPFVMFSNNANTVKDDSKAKAYAITAYTYDTCVFSQNHGYTAFPQGKFSFVGFYLVNETPGAPLAPGTYTAGATTGMYINTKDSGAGYDITSCKASSYPTVASGTVTITALGTGRAGTTGSLNVTMTDGSVFSGDFGTGTCVGGSNTAPNPPTNDPYACATIK